jgi:hypothetical protein
MCSKVKQNAFLTNIWGGSRVERFVCISPEFRTRDVLGEGNAGLAPPDGRGWFLHLGRLAQQFHPAAHLAVTIPHRVAMLVQDVQLRSWNRSVHPPNSIMQKQNPIIIKHTPATKYHYFAQEAEAELHDAAWNQ